MVQAKFGKNPGEQKLYLDLDESVTGCWIPAAPALPSEPCSVPGKPFEKQSRIWGSVRNSCAFYLALLLGKTLPVYCSWISVCQPTMVILWSVHRPSFSPCGLESQSRAVVQPQGMWKAEWGTATLLSKAQSAGSISMQLCALHTQVWEKLKC